MEESETNPLTPPSPEPSSNNHFCCSTPNCRYNTLLYCLAGLLILVILSGVAYLYRTQNKLLVPRSIITEKDPTPTVDTIAIWKTYTNQDNTYSFKYPPDWVLTEEENGVKFIIEPDYRMVVGACPGYSFWVGKPDPYANYSIYTPLQKKVINGINVDYHSKMDSYGCTQNIAFFGGKSTIVSLTSKKVGSQQLFDQILSTFRFLDQPTPAPSPAVVWKTYTNTYAGYSLSYPNTIEPWTQPTGLGSSSTDGTEHTVEFGRNLSITIQTGNFPTGEFPEWEQSQITINKLKAEYYQLYNNNNEKIKEFYIFLNPTNDKYIQLFIGDTKSSNYEVSKQVLSTFKLIK